MTVAYPVYLIRSCKRSEYVSSGLPRPFVLSGGRLEWRGVLGIHQRGHEFDFLYRRERGLWSPLLVSLSHQADFWNQPRSQYTSAEGPPSEHKVARLTHAMPFPAILCMRGVLCLCEAFVIFIEWSVCDPDLKDTRSAGVLSHLPRTRASAKHHQMHS